MADVGERIRLYRERKHYKVKDFAVLIGISQGTLSDIENEKTKPSAKTLSALVRNTGIDSRWLLTGIWKNLKSKVADQFPGFEQMEELAFAENH